MSREAALLIGLIASVIAAAIEQLSGPGIFTSNQGETIVNVLTILGPIIAGAFTRYQVYSKTSVQAIQATAAATGQTPALPPPP
jgi:hypothetical protein